MPRSKKLELRFPIKLTLAQRKHIQAAIGWTNSHLHYFRSGSPVGRPMPVTQAENRMCRNQVHPRGSDHHGP
jgi:hypothetical protein